MNEDAAQMEGTGSLRLKISLWGSPEQYDFVPPELTMPAGATLDDLLARLSILVGWDLRTGIAGARAHFLTINGAHCALPSDLTRALNDGDAVALLPFIAGG
jgi:molybdopterin converting factor small subunit